MAFRFSLAALLRVRSTFERVEEGKLQILRREAQLLHLELDQTGVARRNAKLEPAPNLGDASSRTASSFPASPATFLTGADLQFSYFRQTQLAWREQQLQQLVQEKQCQIQDQTITFAEARRQRQVLDSLRDRELGVYEQEERRKDQRRLDDTFLLQLVLRRRAAGG